MLVAGLYERGDARAARRHMQLANVQPRISIHVAIVAVWFACLGAVPEIRAQNAGWVLKPVEADYDSPASVFHPTKFDVPPTPDEPSSIRIVSAPPAVHHAGVSPAEYTQDTSGQPIPLPSYLRDSEEMPQPPFLDTQPTESSMANQIELLKQRLTDLEQTKSAEQDATRSIIRQSFAERGSNIMDSVVFGGVLETLTFWQEDFNDISESNIILDTAELDFDIQMNNWSSAALYIEYFDGNDFLFPTTEGDEVGVDRLFIRRGTITLGNVTRYPVYITTGRDVVPFGISTGDPVADVLTIVDPLTVEVFETREDFIMFGFELPVPGPPPPVSAYSRPPVAPRPILFNPMARCAVRTVCPYCGPLDKPPTVAAVPPTCLAPYFGAIYFYNGRTLEGINDSDHIEQMGGTLGYRTKGTVGNTNIPWTTLNAVDVNSSVFDSNFLQFEYRRFLPQIGFVPGMAAHTRSSVGPVGFVLEWNGAIGTAEFIDDAGNPISISPQAWQVSINYQFDWNPTVEVIGAQGTYLAVGYSESSDLAGVTRIFDPLLPVPTRVGFVPERRFSIGVGEWILDGMRIAFEYSHAIDYSVDEGGTGNAANGFFMQWTYEW